MRYDIIAPLQLGRSLDATPCTGGRGGFKIWIRNSPRESDTRPPNSNLGFEACCF